MPLPIGILCTDVIPPTVSAFSPSNGGSVSGTTTISATVTDNDAVASVVFKIDGTTIATFGSSGPYSKSYDTHLLTAASHTFTVVATDRVGNVTTVNHTATVTNTVPSSGFMLFGEWEPSDGGGGYVSQSRDQGSAYNNRWTDDYIWSPNEDGTGTKAPETVPSNPDSTHYVMQVQFGTNSQGRTEGGSAGNVINVTFRINGATEYNGFSNGATTFGPYQSGPIVNVNGGESIDMSKWETIPGTNTSYTQGCGIYYFFSVAGGYLS